MYSSNVKQTVEFTSGQIREYMNGPKFCPVCRSTRLYLHLKPGQRSAGEICTTVTCSRCKSFWLEYNDDDGVALSLVGVVLTEFEVEILRAQVSSFKPAGHGG